MVLFCELFLVLTLAAYYSNADIPDPLERHSCEGKVLCDIKPDDYPQEEMDRLVAQNLHHLHRMRRSTPDLETSADTSDAEGCASTKKMITPYTVQRKDVLHVVQTELFSQQVLETSCKDEGSSCHESLTDVSPSSCANKIGKMFVIVLTKSNELIQEPVDVKTDCVCEMVHN